MRPWLISAANVLNELPPGRRSGGRAQEEEEESCALGRPQDERLERLLDALAPLLFCCEDSQGRPQAAPDAPVLLFVEPGTRLGGITVTRLRALALERGLNVMAPCTHQAACPLLTGKGNRSWCHFTFDGLGAPDWAAPLVRGRGPDQKQPFTVAPAAVA